MDKGRREEERKPDPKARAKAVELHERGMPFQMAMAVAHGRLALSDALERMATSDKAQRLMEAHDLSRALAVQIAKGHADLEAVLARRRFEAYKEADTLRSCLEEAASSGAPLTLGLHGLRTVTGRVVEARPYHVLVHVDGADAPEEIHKLLVKYAHEPGQWKAFRKVLKWDKAIKAAPRGPIERPQDRYTCSTKRLFRYLDEKVVVSAVLLEGEILRGTVIWFSRYEIGLQLRPDCAVTVFRHALQDLGSD